MFCSCTEGQPLITTEMYCLYIFIFKTQVKLINLMPVKMMPAHGHDETNMQIQMECPSCQNSQWNQHANTKEMPIMPELTMKPTCKYKWNAHHAGSRNISITPMPVLPRSRIEMFSNNKLGQKGVVLSLK